MGFADVRPICSRCGLPVDPPHIEGQDHAYLDACIKALRTALSEAYPIHQAEIRRVREEIVDLTMAYREAARVVNAAVFSLRTFRNVPVDQQQWTSIDDDVMSDLLTVLAEADRRLGIKREAADEPE